MGREGFFLRAGKHAGPPVLLFELDIEARGDTRGCCLSTMTVEIPVGRLLILTCELVLVKSYVVSPLICWVHLQMYENGYENVG